MKMLLAGGKYNDIKVDLLSHKDNTYVVSVSDALITYINNVKRDHGNCAWSFKLDGSDTWTIAFPDITIGDNAVIFIMDVDKGRRHVAAWQQHLDDIGGVCYGCSGCAFDCICPNCYY